MVGSDNGSDITINRPPAFTACPGNQTANTDVNTCNAVVSYTAAASGTPAPALSYTFSGATAGSGSGAGSGSTFNKGVTTVVITATNSCGSATCSFTVTVNDNTPPTITCPGNITVNNDPGICGAVVNFNDATVTDNCAMCDITSISGYTYLGKYNGHTYFISNTQGQWASFKTAAESLGGHLATVTSAGENTFLVGKTTTRAWIGLTDQAMEGTWAWVTGEPYTYTNWCPAEPNGSTVENWVIMNWCSGGGWNDGSNNTCCPQNAIIEFDCGAVQTGGPASGSTFPVGTTTVSYTANDGSGNTNSCSFTVTVNDTEPPSITCPANTTVSCDGDSSPAATGTPAVGDNCAVASPGASHSDVITAGNCAGNYSIARTWMVRDVNGNVNTCTQTITVEDKTGPTAICQNATVTLSGGSAIVTPGMIDNGSFDDCSGIASTTVSPNSFGCANIGNNTVTLTVVDNCGNTSTCTATVTVVGIIPSCSITVTPCNNTNTGGVPTNLYLGYGPQCATMTANPNGGTGFSYVWTGPTAYLDCTTCQTPVFTPTQPGTYTYTVTVFNANGCTTTCSVTFCVKDVVAPSNGNSTKIYICHIPQGNPANASTLSVSTNAVASHLAHGDYLGQCGQGCGAPVTARLAGSSGGAIGEEVKVYPNPNNGAFVVEIPYTEEERTLITVSDVQGKLIQRKAVTDADGLRIRLDLGDVARGVYFLEVVYGNQRFRTKLHVR
jgi:hypothetical protein